MPNVTLVRRFQFEAAHRLPKVPVDHKCYRLHGHSYRVEIEVTGPIDPDTGWFIDYADLKQAWTPLRQALDHSCLNEVEGLENPTSENLAVWIWQHMVDRLPGLSAVTIMETCSARAIYRGD